MIIASIDIGTNTILMLICRYDNSSGRLETILNEHRIPRIGKGLVPGGPVSDQKTNELLDILKEYSQAAKKYKCEKIIASATNAFRIASNRDELIMRIKKETGIIVNVISGEEESYYSYLGASEYSFNSENLLVIDIGGGSTEIITGTGSKILYRKSFHTGVVSLTEKYLLTSPPSFDEVKGLNVSLQETFEELNDKNFTIGKAVAIAGTPTTLACIKQNLDLYNEDAIEGSTLSRRETGEMSAMLSKMTPEEIKDAYKAVVSGREDVLLAGSLILFHLMNILKLDEVIVSTKGIRYGAVLANVH